MVLRGSGTAPDQSLSDAQAQLSHSKDVLKKQHQAVVDTEKEVVIELMEHTKEISAAAPGKLHRLESHSKLDALGNKLQSLKEEERRAQDDYAARFQAAKGTLLQLVAGGTAGALARSTVAPMDRIKILMQVAHVQKTTHLYPNMGKTARHILATEGITGFWRGNLTNCIRVIPHAATQFVTYDKIKVAIIGDSQGKMTVPQKLLAGSLSGVAAASVTQPLDVLRVRLQTDPEVKGKVFNAARAMWSEGGIVAFYKGYTPAMLSLAPFIAVNFATFDTLKGWYYSNASYSKQELKDRNPLVVLSLGAISGIVAQSICYPLDTVRRRMQTKSKVVLADGKVSLNYYRNTPMAFLTIFREEGVKGFYRGMIPNALKVMPNNALRFAIYETLKNFFEVGGGKDDGGSGGG